MSSKGKKKNLPVPADVYLDVDVLSFGGLVVLFAALFVDGDVLVVPAGSLVVVGVLELVAVSVAVLGVDVHLLDALGSLLLGSCGGEGGIASFVTFPSNARSFKVDFALYLDFSSFFCCDSVTPIRGREDTEGDRDAGVKVQIDWSRGALS